MRLPRALSRLLAPPPARRRAPRPLEPDELLRRVEKIALASRRRATAVAAGDYRAVFQGRGMEFSEVRDYRPGDDVRTIDWNVTARAGAPHVKIYREERDRTVLLLVDLSASQDYGSGLATKRELAAEATAAVVLSAARAGDRVGAVLFSDRLERVFRPARGKGHALAIVREVLELPLSGFGTDIGLALRAARHALKSRGLVVLISDFRAGGYERELGLLSRRHEVVALATTDPAEQLPPRAGLLLAAEPESGAVAPVDLSSARVRRQWQEALPSAAALCRRLGVDFLELSSRRAPSADLAAFFHSRARRANRAGA